MWELMAQVVGFNRANSPPAKPKAPTLEEHRARVERVRRMTGET